MIFRRFSLILAGLGMGVAGCKLLTGKVNLDVPDQVQMNKVSGAIQLQGTRMFIIPPKDFELMQSLGRFEKDEDDYLDLIESQTTNFYKRKSHVDAVMDVAKTQGLKIYYEKLFYFGPYRAYILYGPETNPDREQIVMLVGNDNFVSTVAGVFPKGDGSARRDILKSMYSLYIDSTLNPDASIFARYTLSLAGTSFLYCDHGANSYYYTVNGVGHPATDLSEDQIRISEIPAMTSKATRTYALQQLDKYREAGFTIKSQQVKDTTMNGLYACELILQASLKGVSNSVCQIVTSNQKEGVLFCGIAYQKPDSLIQQYIHIAGSLHFK